MARAGVLEQYVEHGKQAQRSHGGRIACFDRWVVRNAGYSRPGRFPGFPTGYSNCSLCNALEAFTEVDYELFNLTNMNDSDTWIRSTDS